MSPLLAGGQPLIQPPASSQMGPFQGPLLTPPAWTSLARAPSQGRGSSGFMTTLALPPCRVQVLSLHFSPQPPVNPFFPFTGLSQLMPKRALLQ